MNGAFWASYRRRVWQERLDRLDAYLRQLKQRENGYDRAT
jgi:hypothetical protein